MRWGRGLNVLVKGCSRQVATYILSEAALRTTSFGILASGVLEALGGVLRNGGGNPGGKFPAKEELDGVGALAGVGVRPGSMPAARRRPSRELGSGTGVDVAAGGAGCWYGS